MMMQRLVEPKRMENIISPWFDAWSKNCANDILNKERTQTLNFKQIWQLGDCNEHVGLLPNANN